MQERDLDMRMCGPRLLNDTEKTDEPQYEG
jgi:hypothetical protein